LFSSTFSRVLLSVFLLTAVVVVVVNFLFARNLFSLLKVSTSTRPLATKNVSLAREEEEGEEGEEGEEEARWHLARRRAREGSEKRLPPEVDDMRAMYLLSFFLTTDVEFFLLFLSQRNENRQQTNTPNGA
jgi:uncharacterized protein HemY